MSESRCYLEQRVRVVAVSADGLSVAVEGDSACAACAAGKGCGNAWLGRLFRRPVPLWIEGHWCVGDCLLLHYPQGILEKRAAWLYGVLLAALLAGGVAGRMAGVQWGAGSALQDLLSVLGSLGGMILGVRFLRYRFFTGKLPQPTLIDPRGAASSAPNPH